MDLFNCISVGYLIGCVNPAYFFSRMKGFDIRNSGSGNAGGSNALITMGKAIGFFCMIFDIFKAYFAVTLARALCGSFTYAYAVSTVACIFGHIFPFYLKFRGGKGLACLGGCIFAYSPIVFVIMISAEAVIAFVTDYICLVPITASVAYPIVYGCLSHDVPGAVLLTSVTVIILSKHRENIDRIKKGTEIKISYLWHGDEEIERIKKNSENK